MGETSGHPHRIIRRTVSKNTVVERRLANVCGYPSKPELVDAIEKAGLERFYPSGDGRSGVAAEDQVRIVKLGELVFRVGGRAMSLHYWRTMLAIDVKPQDPPNVFR